jgi:L-iditol 2-dehydrogenase
VKACVLHSIGQLRIEEVPTPIPGRDEVLLRVLACGVCGSDFPRIFTQGAHRMPIIPGHECCGVVTHVGADVPKSWVGKRCAVFPLLPCRKCRFCKAGRYALCRDYDYIGSRRDGGMAEYLRVPTWNLLPLHPDVTPEAGALVEPAAVTLHALAKAHPRPGDAVLIFGAGPIGLLVGLWAQLYGCAPILMVDIAVESLRFAQKIGFTHLFDATTSPVYKWAQNKVPDGPPIVVEASGASAALEQALLAVRPQGTVILLGNPAHEMRVTQNAYWAILRKELRVLGSWNSDYADTPRNDWEAAVHAMATERLSVLPLITHRVTLQDLPSLLRKVHEKQVFARKILVVFD